MHKVFTQEEKDFILINREKLTISKIAKKLNRSYKSIYSFLYFKNLTYKKERESIRENNELTPTEQKVVNLICKKGILKRIELAEKLFVEECTIITHLRNIYTKTNCHSIAELIFKYYNGLISESQVEDEN